MNRTPSSLRVLVAAVVLTLLALPLAGALPLERQQTTHRTNEGWIAAAVKWLEGVAAFRRSAIERHQSNSPTLVKDGNSTTGGGCIDPQGWPRPRCAD